MDSLPRLEVLKSAGNLLRSRFIRLYHTNGSLTLSVAEAKVVLEELPKLLDQAADAEFENSLRRLAHNSAAVNSGTNP